MPCNVQLQITMPRGKLVISKSNMNFHSASSFITSWFSSPLHLLSSDLFTIHISCLLSRNTHAHKNRARGLDTAVYPLVKHVCDAYKLAIGVRTSQHRTMMVSHTAGQNKFIARQPRVAKPLNKKKKGRRYYFNEESMFRFAKTFATSPTWI